MAKLTRMMARLKVDDDLDGPYVGIVRPRRWCEQEAWWGECSPRLRPRAGGLPVPSLPNPLRLAPMGVIS